MNEDDLVMEMIDDLFDDTDNDEQYEYTGKRLRIKGIKGRDQYVIIDDGGIMITFPDNKYENWNYMSTATALTRIISIALQAGVDMDGIKKQLEESSMQDGDTPAILLEAINKYEDK